MPNYDFKRLEEAAWFALVAILVVVLEALVKFDVEVFADWKDWLIGIGAASVRAAAGALLAYFFKPTA